MRNKFIRSLSNSSLSIIPIIAIVFVLSFTGLARLGVTDYFMLGIGTITMIIGLALFQIGAQNSLIKVGEYMGSSLSRQKSIVIVIIFAFLLGGLITCAEPSILIIANQVNINKWLLIFSIAAGVGIFVVLGIVRIIFRKSLNVWFLVFYLLVFCLICILEVDPSNHAYLPFIFDAGGVTTGSATVPFILSLGVGVAMTHGGNKSRDSSFGLVGLASIGPIITMIILILVNPAGFSAYEVEALPNIALNTFDISYAIKSLFIAFIPHGTSLGSMIEVLMALLPIMVIFFIYEAIYIKISKKKIVGLLIGFLFSYVGLTLFLSAVSSTMSPIGLKVGQKLAASSNAIIIIIAFILGMVTILCEPAVNVLTSQVEDISDGQVKKRTVLLALSIGVGIAICLSVIRTLYNFSIMYYIIPGYFLSLVMMFFVPDLYTAIAFDSGGTASGPMTVSFILPLIIGIYSVRENITSSVSFYENAFGVVALVAMLPILAIQILGVTGKFKNMYALRLIRQQIHDERNNEIIHFN
ncbi:MAG: DUF1538 domain-containing protein [Bacilli bacterium]|nr:DUF1538 domain-containing protein [Bacilli bacterium]